jgi:DNA-binding response OmpR family regulator
MRLLFVGAEDFVSSELRVWLESRSLALQRAGSLEAASATMQTERFDLVLLDLGLSIEGCLSLLEDLGRRPTMPQVIVMAEEQKADLGLRLGQLGARAVIGKPCGLAELASAIDMLRHPPNLTPLVRVSVGLISLHEIEEQVRRDMVNEALARSEGSRRRAALLLHISRQLLQHIMRKFESCV